jgi:tetratricopeptide (TPR) repeat protein
VVGTYTLTYSLPRAIGIGKSRSGIDYPGGVPEELFQTGRSERVESFPYPDRKPKMPSQGDWEEAVAEDSGMYPDMAKSMNKAKEFLNLGNADAALKSLETFMAGDFRGVHTTVPEFNALLFACQQALGIDTRNIENRIAEMRLDWLSALKKGEELLRKGQAEESIAYFTRSISMNPGEAGTASAEQAARDGITAAQALLKRRVMSKTKDEVG